MKESFPTPGVYELTYGPPFQALRHLTASAVFKTRCLANALLVTRNDPKPMTARHAASRVMICSQFSLSDTVSGPEPPGWDAVFPVPLIAIVLRVGEVAAAADRAGIGQVMIVGEVDHMYSVPNAAGGIVVEIYTICFGRRKDKSSKVAQVRSHPTDLRPFGDRFDAIAAVGRGADIKSRSRARVVVVHVKPVSVAEPAH